MVLVLSWSCYFGLGLGLVSSGLGLGLGLVTLVLVLRIWSCLHHGYWLGRWPPENRSQVGHPMAALSGSDPAQLIHICVPMTPSSIICYCPKRAVTLCSWEGNRRSGVALEYWTCVADTTLPTGWRATKGRQNRQQRSSGWDFFIWRL